MPQNTVASGRAWLYVKNVGRQGQVGMGFSQPVGVATLDDGTMYVANRRLMPISPVSLQGRPWMSILSVLNLKIHGPGKIKTRD